MDAPEHSNGLFLFHGDEPHRSHVPPQKRTPFEKRFDTALMIAVAAMVAVIVTPVVLGMRAIEEPRAQPTMITGLPSVPMLESAITIAPAIGQAINHEPTPPSAEAAIEQWWRDRGAAAAAQYHHSKLRRPERTERFPGGRGRGCPPSLVGAC